MNIVDQGNAVRTSLEESCPVEEKESKQAKGEENKHKLEEIRRKSDGELWSDQINKCGG